MLKKKPFNKNSCLFKIYLHMKIKHKASNSPCNPKGTSCLMSSNILLPVTWNCFKINNKIISDDENSWCFGFFWPRYSLFRHVML